MDGGLVAAGPPRSASLELGGAGLALVDQALYSASNVAITVLVARAATVREFGVFALVYAIVVLLQGTVDGLVGETFAVLHTDSPPEQARSALRKAAGASMVLGAAAATLLALTGAVLDGPARALLFCYAALVPALVMQSLWRFVSFALTRPRTAVANDAIWVCVQVVGLVAVIASGHASPALLVLAWGAGAVAAALAGFRQLGVAPRPLAGVRWLRQTSQLGFRYAAEFLGTFGASQVALAVTGSIAGLAAVAQLRGAQLLYGPITTLANSVRVAGAPIAIRQKAWGTRRLRQVSLVIGGGLAVLVLAWTGLILLAPDALGEAVAGDSWALAREVVPPVAISTMCAGLAAGLVVSLRASADARHSLRGRLATGLLRLAGAAIGAAIAGGTGAAWGLALGAVLGLSVLYGQYLASQADHGPSRQASDG